mmetsp:Transcript_19772/g.22084  ORF Transcript_19772/g.22084 Transcript_19772/m.22084 type:complete len:83 (+) Transcript_19772:244-492(+)
MKETDLKESSKAPFSRAVEKEYMLKIKKDFDSQYLDKMKNKEDEINSLKVLVMKQQKVITDMKSQSGLPSKSGKSSDDKTRG